ncbi:MAG: hypothetical protein ACFFBS_07625 [Promethearchaeota archaeon]
MWRIFRPDAARVWKDEVVQERLGRYYDIIGDKVPAKFLICKKIETKIDLQEEMSKLWEEHDKLNERFKSFLKDIDKGDLLLQDMATPETSYLDLKTEIANRILQDCHFCEHRCRINRGKGEKGVCQVDGTARVSSAFLHTGEEAPLVPSGTIFFSGCNFKCAHNVHIQRVHA